MLRTNQCNAVEASVKNNFSSGVHSHATGTGKSWIALELILKYNELYPTKNIMWLCEQKSILVEQFNRQVIKTKGYNSIFERFMILNYTENKPREWYSHVNSSRVWKKPLLLIINRAFLVSQLKYQKINIKIDLIIHDECHSIKNKTTRAFYNFILSKHDVSCIGFSATPCLKFKPFDRIITNYSIYNAYKDKVIVKPVIKWVDRQLNDIEIIFLCKMLINNLPYKKIVVWCGLIETCFKLSKIWNNYFENFIAIDTSKDNSNFEAFKNADKNAILFCACKHREGSDIKNLDCCIFLDKVRNRNANTFVQCIGRVLRKILIKIEVLLLILRLKMLLKFVKD